jgi:hypothetical protein
VWYFRCRDCQYPGSQVAYDLWFIGYITICLYLLLQQKRLGWSLLLIQVIALNGIKVAMVYRFYAHHIFYSRMITMHVIPFLANAAVAVFLLRPFVMEFFRIDNKLKDRTLLFAVIVGVVWMIIL